MVKNTALIFPGQGAQKVGMGLEFFQSSPQAKAIFEQADKICANGLLKVMFEGPEDKLTSTGYCQPAIFTMSVAALEAFRASPQFKDCSVKFTAGHSLGEYAALYAAGVMQFNEALGLVQKRALCMEEGTKQEPGSMAAILNFDEKKLQEICDETGVHIANYNTAGQIVISGSTIKIHNTIKVIESAGGNKNILLSVSGAFHSPLMSSAATKFEVFLNSIKLSPSKIPVLSNVTGQPHVESKIRAGLVRQITSSVQWVKCVEYMAGQGITNFIEIGPGKVLKGLIRRINPALNVYNIEKPQDIEALEI